jgi:hypothetical protein
MTRREWLQKNPPPRAAAQLRVLLQQLEEQNALRNALAGERTRQQQALSYWQSTAYGARAGNDAATLTHANSQGGTAQANIAEIDKQLKASEQVPAQIAEIKGELGRAAKCATHQLHDLVRHKNRPDDLFICEIGPHFFLWTAPSEESSGVLLAWDIKQELPDLDKPMG